MANIFDLFKKIESADAAKKSDPPEFIIVGLGNPGPKYEKTRHNAGFMFLDYVANKCSCSINRSKFKSLCTDATIGGKRVILMKPQTFMNLSGEAVIEAANFYKIPAEKVIVISDDVTLDVSRLRVRKKGSHGGHNGLKNISLHLGTDNYPRIKIGVGQKPHPDFDMIDWVLGNLSDEDIKNTASKYEYAYDGLVKILEGDVEEAMQICNGK